MVARRFSRTSELRFCGLRVFILAPIPEPTITPLEILTDGLNGIRIKPASIYASAKWTHHDTARLGEEVVVVKGKDGNGHCSDCTVPP